VKPGRPAFLWAVAVALLITPIEAAPPETRPFFMGFTPTVYDTTPKAMEDTYAFIDRHADLIAHHFVKGVPWPEAHDQQRFPAAVERDLQFRQLKRLPGQRVFLAVSPITVAAQGLGGYWGAKGNMPRPGSWSRKDFDDPEVITAYANFCTVMIQRFRPDFMAYGIEVNGLVKDAPAEWPKFVKFARLVYSGLKVEHPGLPIFVTLQLDYFWADAPRQRTAIAEILPYTDYLAISTYPYVDRYANPHHIPTDYFARLAALAPSKPFAVAETGFTAQEVTVLGTRVPGRPEWQDTYMKFLLAESARLQARFVVWFVPRDYDLLVNRLKALQVPPTTIQLYGLWRSNGLIDADGKARKALDTWTTWLNRRRAAGAR
jgi:hypothetical protein